MIQNIMQLNLRWELNENETFFFSNLSPHLNWTESLHPYHGGCYLAFICFPFLYSIDSFQFLASNSWSTLALLGLCQCTWECCNFSMNSIINTTDVSIGKHEFIQSLNMLHKAEMRPTRIPSSPVTRVITSESFFSWKSTWILLFAILSSMSA